MALIGGGWPTTDTEYRGDGAAYDILSTRLVIYKLRFPFLPFPLDGC